MLKHKFAGGMLFLMLLVAACQSEPMAIPPSAVPSTPVNALASFQAHPTPTAVSENVIDSADAEYLLLENIYDRVTPSVNHLLAHVQTAAPNAHVPSLGQAAITYSVPSDQDVDNGKPASAGGSAAAPAGSGSGSGSSSGSGSGSGSAQASSAAGGGR